MSFVSQRSSKAIENNSILQDFIFEFKSTSLQYHESPNRILNILLKMRSF